MVLNSNSISLTSREPVAATWEPTWSEGTKSLDREGSRAGEEGRGQLEDHAVFEDQSQKLQEQLMLEQEKKRKEQEAQEEELRKQREAEAQAQAEAEAKARAEAQARAEAEAKARAEAQAQAQAQAEAQRRAEAQKLQAERERETSVKIYQYRRFVPIAERVVPKPRSFSSCGFVLSTLYVFPPLPSLLCTSESNSSTEPLNHKHHCVPSIPSALARLPDIKTPCQSWEAHASSVLVFFLRP